MKVSEVITLMNAQADDAARVDETVVTGFTIDSREVKSGEVFFALSPADYRRHKFTAQSFADAHEFIPQAFQSGAAYIVARRERVNGDDELQNYKRRLLLVDDVIEALQRVARGVIDAWGKTVVGITGSAGKTTTKDLTTHILKEAGKRVVSTQKNYNNELGVPLSVLQMEANGKRAADFDVAVLEMGMSMPGEIKRLTEIAPPDIAVELLVAPVHVEFAGSVAAIANGKADLVRALKADGAAVLNVDDPRVAAMANETPAHIVRYGILNEADVFAREIDVGELGAINFVLHTPRGTAHARLPLSGRHNLMNALAAASVAHELGVEPEAIAQAFATSRPSNMRGEVRRLAFDALSRDGQTSSAARHRDNDFTDENSFIVIDDSYNSNPRSLQAMVGMLSEVNRVREASGRVFNFSKTARRIVVAGEMLELGDESAAYHNEAGREIAKLGNINILIGVRGQAQHIVDGARAAGMTSETARFCTDTDEAANELMDIVRAGDVVLIKGSRGVRLDGAVQRLLARFGDAAAGDENRTNR